jgi:hypothetical protein
MLAKGKIIEALKCQDQRTGRIGELVDLKKISSALSALDGDHTLTDEQKTRYAQVLAERQAKKPS